MAASTYARGRTASDAELTGFPRHSVAVRVTHWLTALSFIALVLSGLAILLAHPRLYWGETGLRRGPSLIDLPLPFVLEMPIRGPGRYVHFLAAWISLFTGLYYVLTGLRTQHFRKQLLPARSDLEWTKLRRVIVDHVRLKRPGEQDALTYNPLQRITYLLVIFIFFPVAIWTGLAMSPAITSVVPGMVTILGGQQSARTVHFFVACLLLLFFVIHIAMIFMAGFAKRIRPMITGRAAIAKERI